MSTNSLELKKKGNKALSLGVVASLVSILVTGILFALICNQSGMVLFSKGGTNTLAINDAYYQYLDFFAWYKDVLSGKDSIFYSFSNGLGQNSMGLFAYYLASPLNLLVVFFDKTQMHEFFMLLVLLKMMLLSLTSSVFISLRYKGKIPCLWNIVGSVSYAFMQYTIAQCNNIMWLDGAVMLPLVLLGVYYLLSKKNGAVLSLAVGISILSCWYVGGINCLFSGFYFLAEFFVVSADEENALGNKIKGFVLAAFRYVSAMIVGVMVSSFVFLPNVYLLMHSRGESISLSSIKSEFIGNPLNTIFLNHTGAECFEGSAGIYSSCLILMGVICFFVAKSQKISKKIALGVLLLFTVMSYYYEPLLIIFSLLKRPDNFWYRYSYLGCFLTIVIAMHFIADLNEEDKKKIWIPVALGVYDLIYIFIQISRPNVINTGKFIRLFIPTVGIFVAYGALYFKNTGKDKIIKYITTVIAVVIIASEIYAGGLAIMSLRDNEQYYPEFGRYQSSMIVAVDELKANDGVYRIDQIQTRSMDPQNDTANFNECLAFNYMSISDFTSTPQNTQIDMLDRIGYRSFREDVTIDTQCIIPTVSLLGVKYVIAYYPVEGLEELSSPNGFDGIRAYENPYALPMAFVVGGRRGDISEGNVFENINTLYSDILGEEVEVMVPVSFSEEVGDEGISYSVNDVDSKYLVYAEIPGDGVRGRVYVNPESDSSREFTYGGGLSTKLFPVERSGDEMKVFYETTNSDVDAMFYGMDTDLIQQIKDYADSRSAQGISMNKTKMEMTVEATAGEYLLLSVPYDSGWKIKVNGKNVKAETFGECLMMVPLESGTNDVSMRFVPQMLPAGIVLTVLGISICALELVIRKRKV